MRLAPSTRPLLGTLFGSLVVLLTIGAAPAGAAATRERSRFIEPFSGEVTNPCGEHVLITGEQVISFVGGEDATGGHHGTLHVRLRNLTAVGVESGSTYQVVSLEQAGGYADADLAPFGSTEIGSFLLVSQGEGVNFVAHGTIHFQVDANGAVTTDVSFSHADCVG